MMKTWREGAAMTLHGIVHGNIIRLDQPLGLADGAEVEVEVSIREQGMAHCSGILNTAGKLANEPDLDPILEEIVQARKLTCWNVPGRP